MNSLRPSLLLLSIIFLAACGIARAQDAPASGNTPPPPATPVPPATPAPEPPPSTPAPPAKATTPRKRKSAAEAADGTVEDTPPPLTRRDVGSAEADLVQFCRALDAHGSMAAQNASYHLKQALPQLQSLRDGLPDDAA